MSDAAARSKGIRLALALATVLIVLGALSWWMSGARDKTVDVAVASNVRAIEASALELTPTAAEAGERSAVSTRRAGEAAAVVDSESQATIDWGRLHVTVRSSAPHVKVTKGTAILAPRVLRGRNQRSTLDLSGDLSGKAGAISGSLAPRIIAFDTEIANEFDANGQVEFNRVPFGDWMLTVAADGFEIVEQLVFIENFGIQDLDITVEPLVLAELAVVLRHPNGIPLFDAVDGALLETVSALRPVFLAECPQIGVDLPSAAHRLVQRSQFVRKEHPDQWMHATFKKPTAGCACVLLGERVLDAVPFVAGQVVVVLRVDPAALSGARASLLVRVREAGLDKPIANVTLTIKDGFGGVRTVQTDALGTVVAMDLPVTDVTVAVADERYLSAKRVVSLSSGIQAEPPTFFLERSTSVRGSLTWPAGEEPVRSVVLMREQPPLSLRGTVILDASGSRGTFAFLALQPDEYLVGFAAGPPYATLESVRNGTKRAWKIADTRPGNVDNIVIDVPQDLLDLVGDQR